MVSRIALGVVGLCVFVAPMDAQGRGARKQARAEETPAEEFRRLGEALYRGDCPIMGTALARAMEEELAKTDLTERQRVQALMVLGQELGEAGKTEESIERLEEALRRATDAQLEAAVPMVHRLLAVSYLRLAENRNCIDRKTPTCCILPLREGALHAEREPAEKAREHYAAVLAVDPEAYTPRWVYNVLTLLLGESTDDLPPELRIPGSAFGSAKGEPRFHDVGAAAGVATTNLAGGVAVEDFDGDGWLDILSSDCDVLGPMTYLHNSGDGTFENRSESSKVSEQLGGLNMISGDYDNDGDQDALVLRGAWLLDYGRMRKSLLQNDAGRTFTDVTRKVGLAEPAFPTQAGVWGDFDSDGWLDLYVGCESRIESDAGKLKPGEGDYPSQLYHSNGDGTFTDVAERAGVLNQRYAKGATVGDYDDDGDLDLYVSNIGANRLYRNDGRMEFDDVAEQAGVSEPVKRSFACWFFDYDNDGGLDLWVSGYQCKTADLALEALFRPDAAVRPRLYRNQRDGTFGDVTPALGLARPFAPMGANFGDFENDGWLDIYLGTGDPELESLMPNVALANRAGKRFDDVTASSGLGHLQKGHGVAFADLDHDGDQDVYHVLGGFVPVDRYQNALFQNDGPSGRWLYLDLVGTKTNRDAVGARVRVELETPAGTREVHRAPGAVSSFGGSPHRLEIGLGDATRIRRLEIRWPRTEELQVFEDVPLDSYLRVREGEKAFERLELKQTRT